MVRLVLSRLVRLIPVLIIVSIGTFLMVDLVPGDPAEQVLGPNSTREEYLRVRESMGLDEPLVDRYFEWVGNALQGDLGRNLVPPVEDVSTRLARAFPVNIELAVLALLMALAVSVPLAMWTAQKPNGRADRLATSGTFAVIAVPPFLASIVLVLVFAIQFQIFPLGQWVRPTDGGWASNLHHAFLPALTLALPEMATFTRVLRADMISTLQEDYIAAARGKGLPQRLIVFRHALRPSSFSLITLVGVSVGRLMGGTIVIEQVFSLPGVGRVVVDGARQSDFTVVQSGVLAIAVVYVVVGFLVDIAYGYLDPRVGHARG